MTGVQTCALPIFNGRHHRTQPAHTTCGRTVPDAAHNSDAGHVVPLAGTRDTGNDSTARRAGVKAPLSHYAQVSPIQQLVKAHDVKDALDAALEACREERRTRGTKATGRTCSRDVTDTREPHATKLSMSRPVTATASAPEPSESPSPSLPEGGMIVPDSSWADGAHEV